ncbi:MAG: hypothetical protein PHI34_13165 [Acidobacteriota bacterium]|nr:hypothetical protein [Acidobacteriota bacterium]
MRIKTARLLSLVWLLAVAASLPGQAPPASDKPGAAPKRLLRMEYLKPRAAAPAAPLRDIFSPGGFAGSVVPGYVGRPAAGKAGGAVEAIETEEPPVPALDLRFVGFSYNPAQKRTIGLVLLDGVARAVAEGETLPNGLKVVRVTRGELEVRGPDGKSLTFSLEGVDR